MNYPEQAYLQSVIARIFVTQTGPDDLAYYTATGQRVLDEIGAEYFSKMMVSHNPYLLTEMMRLHLSEREVDQSMQELYHEIDTIWEIPGF